jgi:hypothetical protein
LATPPSQPVPSRSWRLIAIVLAVVLVAGGAVFFFLRNNSSDGTVGTGATPGANAPRFHFKVKKTAVIPVVAKDGTGGEATDAANDIATTLSNMYGLAFLDPDHWKPGDYDVVFGFFAPGKAAASARRDEATLTLGPDAGAMFDDVQPTSGGLVVRVLTDRGGKPFTSAATADFTADATKKDGSVMLIKSHATYYLRRGQGGWVIIGFRAERLDGGEGTTSGGSSTPGAGGSS